MGTMRKSGTPFLFDSDTGDVVGIVDADGSERLFAFANSRRQVTDATGRSVATPTTTGVDRLYCLNNSNWGNGSTTARTTFIKREAEASFSRVRMWIIKRTDASESTASGNWTAIVAPTETAADDTQSNRYYPTSGGAAQNTAVNQANPNGWRTVTWSGASSAQITGTSDVNKPLFLVSDWIDCKSVSRVDGSLRPLLLARVRFDATSGTSSRYTGFTNWSGGATAESFYRIIASEWINSDGVASLTTTPAGTQYGNFGLTVFFEFDYDVPVRSVYVAGDSLFASSNGSAALEFDGWASRAIYSKSTPSAPIVLSNGGLASRTTQDYVDNGLIVQINAGARPNDVVVLAGSGNDTSAFTEFGNNNARGAVMRALTACRAIGANVYLATTPPRAYSGSQETFRQALNTWTRNLCATGAATLFDFDAVLSDGASPARLSAAFNSGDGIHPNQAGTIALAGEFTKLIA